MPKVAKKRAVRGKKLVVLAKPRIGAMTPQDFERAASAALGGWGWQKAFRRGTGLDQSTITRYLKGVFPIPQHVALIVQMLATLRNNGLPVPEAFSAEPLHDGGIEDEPE